VWQLRVEQLHNAAGRRLPLGTAAQADFEAARLFLLTAFVLAHVVLTACVSHPAADRSVARASGVSLRLSLSAAKPMAL